MIPDLNDLYFFVQVVDHGGFAPAARALNQPKSKLSRRVALLEERLGVRLIQRSTRRFNVTDIGQAYYAHCKAMLVEADAAQTLIDNVHAELCGTLRLACPTALLHACAGRMLVRFARRHPQVGLQIDALDRPADVIGEGFDVVLRVTPPPLADSDLALRVLGEAPQLLVAAPSLIERHATPQQPADLESWPSLGHGPAMERYAWKLLGPGGKSLIQPHAPRFTSTDLAVLCEAAQAGLGVAKLPTLLIGDALADGNLRRVLPDWAPPPEIIHAIFPSRRGLIPAVRALLDHLAEEFRGNASSTPSRPDLARVAGGKDKPLASQEKSRNIEKDSSPRP